MPRKKQKRDVRDQSFDTAVNGDIHHERVRIRQELAARRSKPNPQARPAAKDSPALAALRRSLRNASGAKRQRIQRLIEHTASLYRPSMLPPSLPSRTSVVGNNKNLHERRPQHGTIKAYAAELLQHVDHTDGDGRPIGLTHDEILKRVLVRFPVVLTRGRHKGKPTRFNLTDLKAVRAELAADGTSLPYRIREATDGRSAGPVLDTGKSQRAKPVLYHGQPCRHCGATLRYRSCAACVACAKNRSATQNHARVINTKNDSNASPMNGRGVNETRPG